jgi:enoyl-CoA hydratase
LPEKVTTGPPAMTEDPVLVSRHGAAGLLTINRAKVHNALNGETLRALAAQVHEMNCAEDVGAIVITGAGDRAFSAGADLDELTGLDTAAAVKVLQAGQDVMSMIEGTATPVIAAVNGLALGGGFELVLASAFAILSSAAAMGLPESGLGLIPGFGGTQRLPRAVSPAVATYLMLTGARLSAQRAYDLGLTPLPPVEPQDLLSTALEVADTVSGRGPEANAAILSALQTTAPTRHDLRLETLLAAIAAGSGEARTGIAAFKDRRQPVFRRTPGTGD